MMDKVRAFFRLAFSHKLKYLVTLITFLIFFIVLFPFQDVGDMVGAQVAKMTNNQVYLQFDRLKLGLFPEASVGAENISIETPMIPMISAREIEVHPALSAFITQKPAGTLIAKGLFKGDVLIDVKPGKKTESGGQTHLLSLKAENMNLSEVQKIAELPILLKGKMNLMASGAADPTFQEQPDFDIDLKVDHLEIPSSTVNTAMGPLNLPDLRLSAVELKGRLSAGRLNIEKGIVGKEGDELFGTVKGGISIILQNRGGLQPLLGAYNFDIDLNVKKSFQDKASLFLSFLEAYKTPTAEGGFKYQFRVNASSVQLPPNMSALR